MNPRVQYDWSNDLTEKERKDLYYAADLEHRGENRLADMLRDRTRLSVSKRGGTTDLATRPDDLYT